MHISGYHDQRCVHHALWIALHAFWRLGAPAMPSRSTSLLTFDMVGCCCCCFYNICGCPYVAERGRARSRARLLSILTSTTQGCSCTGAWVTPQAQEHLQPYENALFPLVLQPGLQQRSCSKDSRSQGAPAGGNWAGGEAARSTWAAAAAHGLLV